MDLFLPIRRACKTGRMLLTSASGWMGRSIGAVGTLALLSFLLGEVNGQTLIERQYTNLNLTIPDNDPSGVVDVRSISGSPRGSVILDVNVGLKFSGPAARNGDLYVALDHSSGFTVLLNRVGRSTNNLVGYEDPGLDILLDDESENGDIHHYRAVLFGNHETPVGQALGSAWSGAWAPDGRNVDPAESMDTSVRQATLSSLKGLAVDGRWRLFVADIAAGGVSQLEQWSLKIASTTNINDVKLSFEDATFRADSEARRLDTPITVKGQVAVTGGADTTLAGNVDGTGALIKKGGGALVLSGVNTFSGGIVLEEGTLVLGGDRGSGIGKIQLKGGKIESTGGKKRIDNAVSLGGKLNFSGGIELGGSVSLASLSEFTIENDTVITGDIEETEPGGGFIKKGNGTLTLSGVNSFSGGISLEEGTLVLGNDRALGTGTLSLKGGRVEASGGERKVSNPVTLGGTLDFSGGLTFTGDVSLSDLANLQIEGNTTFSGTLKEETPGTGFVKAGGGTLTLEGANTISGGVNLEDGTLAVNNRTGSGTGSGLVSLKSKTGGVAKSVRSKQSQTDFSGPVLKGNGSIAGSVAVGSGTAISPGSVVGTLTTGSETWEAGGRLIWEINDASGNEGAEFGWDTLKVNGVIQINGTSENPFVIQTSSLGQDNSYGNAVRFDSSKQYVWKIAQTTGGISGFDISTCRLDTTQFSNALNGGTFKLELQGNDLVLVFAGVKRVNITSVLRVNNAFRISLDGTASQSYRVEATDSLSQPNWVSVGTVQANAVGAAQFDAPLPPGLPMRFFRVVTP